MCGATLNEIALYYKKNPTIATFKEPREINRVCFETVKILKKEYSHAEIREMLEYEFTSSDIEDALFPDGKPTKGVHAREFVITSQMAESLSELTYENGEPVFPKPPAPPPLRTMRQILKESKARRSIPTGCPGTK